MQRFEEPLLKAVDLFHLIQNFASFEITINRNGETNKYSSFLILVHSIQQIYFKNFDKSILNNYESNHFFTSSNDFIGESFNILIPEIFVSEIDNKLNNNIRITNERGRNRNNNNMETNVSGRKLPRPLFNNEPNMKTNNIKLQRTLFNN